MDIGVRSDIIATHDWEGVPCEGIVYYIIACLDDGTQFAHFKGFDHDDEAQEFAAKIAAADRAPDFAGYWREIDPSYGSEAFQRREAGAGKDKCPDCFDAHRNGIDGRCRYHGGES